ncbi:Cro/CI family transcriptional regulator [Snodgrassella alvi]|uniref:Cro/CI family transcriptional regulator n=1 Tax=Snodgrassella alvi TaxID=1196083 RepID=UPI003D036689
MYEKDVKFIIALGGVSRVAKICGITRGAVSQWKKNGIPKAQFNYLKTLHSKEYKNLYGK